MSRARAELESGKDERDNVTAHTQEQVHPSLFFSFGGKSRGPQWFGLRCGSGTIAGRIAVEENQEEPLEVRDRPLGPFDGRVRFQEERRMESLLEFALS